MKNILLFCILLLCGTYLQAQTETAQQKINQLVGTWSFVALSDGTDSLVIGSPEIPFAEQLFVVWQEASDIGEDSINAQILTDGQIGNDGKAFVYYSSYLGSTGWKIDFLNEEPPRLFIVNDTMLIIKDGAGYNSYFTRMVISCADLPTPTINGNLILCTNDTSVLSIADTYSSYQWYKRPYFLLGSIPQPIAGATSATYTVNGNADILYYFSVVVTQGICELIANEVLINESTTFSPYIERAGMFGTDTNDNTILCNSDALLLINTDALLLIIHSMPNPQWYKDGVAMPNETNDTLIVTAAGSYTVLGTDFCGMPTSLGVEIPVIAANTPMPVINVVACNQLYQVVNANEFEHLYWYYELEWFGNQALSYIGESGSYLSIQSCGNCTNHMIYVTATDSYGCANISNPYYFGCSGIEEIYGSKIRVYPNPATNFVQIENSGSEQIKALNIIDATGRVVLSQTPLSNNHSPTLLVQNLAVGMYYCQIVLSNGILYRPFAKF